MIKNLINTNCSPLHVKTNHMNKYERQIKKKKVNKDQLKTKGLPLMTLPDTNVPEEYYLLLSVGH